MWISHSAQLDFTARATVVPLSDWTARSSILRPRDRSVDTGPFEASQAEVLQLISLARRALHMVAPSSSIERRRFDFADRGVILLAARVAHGRRAPRDPEMIRRSLELGTGLQLRAIGNLAIVAIELPFAGRATS